MKKYLMTIQFCVEASDRARAYVIADQIIDKHLRGLSDITFAHELGADEALETIAVNEPVRKDPLKESIKYHSFPAYRIK